MGPVSGPVHLRLGPKDKVWRGLYEEAEPGTAQVETIGDEEDEDLDGDEDCPCWGNNDHEGEGDADGYRAEVEWEVPHFPVHPAQLPHSQHFQLHGAAQKAPDNVTVEDSGIHAAGGDAFRPLPSRHRPLPRARAWRRLRSGVGLGVRLTQHWKSWRQRAQWSCSREFRSSRRTLRFHLDKKRRMKGGLQTPYANGHHGNQGPFTHSDTGKA